MHAYRPIPATRSDRGCRRDRPAVGLGASGARSWGVLFIDLRDHYGITQVLADGEPGLSAALRWSGPNG